MLQMLHYHFQKVVFFTWVTVCILFNSAMTCRFKNLWWLAVKLIQDQHVSKRTFRKRTFRDIPGIHCACDSLHTLYWSKVEKVFVWNSSDLDHILVEGDLLCKSIENSWCSPSEWINKITTVIWSFCSSDYLGAGTKMTAPEYGDLQSCS